MTDDSRKYRKALQKIADAVKGVLDSSDDPCDGGNGGGGDDPSPGVRSPIVCTPKVLPADMQIEAARVATEINSFNAPDLPQFALAEQPLEITPQFIAVSTTKYWGPTPRTLTVSFMETTSRELKRRIIGHMNAWTRTGCIKFVETTSGVGQVRISRGRGGFFSYLGTDIRLISSNQQTMNLEGFTMNTPDREFYRVVRHETGHTLGFPHEHMRRDLVARVDPEKAYRYFGGPPNFWTRSMVDAQVLTPLDERSLMATPADQTSIMCYQLPASITRDGRPILGGIDINQTDYDFCGRIYPKPGAQAQAQQGDGDYSDAPDVDEDLTALRDIDVQPYV